MPTPSAPDRASASTPSRRALAITVFTPDQEAIRAAVSLEAMPPLPRCVPAPPTRSSSRESISVISDMSEASASVRGSAVSTPSVSVSSTSRSAWTRLATKAAIRSLSPQRISSSAMASFSLTTGTTPSSSSLFRVVMAWTYWERMMKSSGTSSTWPATRPWRARASL